MAPGFAPQRIVSVEQTDFQFLVDSFEGYRLIRTIYPRRIVMSVLSTEAARYLALWDEVRPTVLLTDVSAVRNPPEELRGPLVAVLQRTVLQPGFVASSWVVGENAPMERMLRESLIETRRDPDTLFETEEDAMAYLRSFLRTAEM